MGGPPGEARLPWLRRATTARRAEVSDASAGGWGAPGRGGEEGARRRQRRRRGGVGDSAGPHHRPRGERAPAEPAPLLLTGRARGLAIGRFASARGAPARPGARRRGRRSARHRGSRRRPRSLERVRRASRHRRATPRAAARRAGAPFHRNLFICRELSRPRCARPSARGARGRAPRRRRRGRPEPPGARRSSPHRLELRPQLVDASHREQQRHFPSGGAGRHAVARNEQGQGFALPGGPGELEGQRGLPRRCGGLVEALGLQPRDGGERIGA